jgi:1-phosphofructokinase family hexose kinase
MSPDSLVTSDESANRGPESAIGNFSGPGRCSELDSSQNEWNPRVLPKNHGSRLADPALAAILPMILCVTLNPCLDKTLTVSSWRPGDLVRGAALREVVGGKGNNVARALRRLGQESRPVTFLGGPTGGWCETLLRNDDAMDPLILPTRAATRVILTVRTDSTAEQTSFFDPDPAVTADEAANMLHQVEEALGSGVAALVLSGSSPAPATHGLFSDLISLARGRKIPVFLDTYGPALEAIWGFWPTAIQLNRREAAAHVRKPTLSNEDATSLLQTWGRHGVECGTITDGPNVVLMHVKGRLYQVTPPRINPVNPIGSGDSFLAGLVDGWLRGLAAEPLIRHAVGCAVANALVWDAGAIDPAEAARWSEQVEIEAPQRRA